MKEKVIKSGAANWTSGIGSKGGKLVLTDTTLYFEGHNFNAGKKEFEVALDDIVAVKKGFINTLTVTTTNGTESFVVNGKGSWVDAIQQAISERD